MTFWHEANPFPTWHSAQSRCYATGFRWQLQWVRFGNQLRRWRKGSATPGQGHLPVAESGPEQGHPGRQDFPMQHNNFSQWNWGASLTHQAQGDGDPPDPWQRERKYSFSPPGVKVVWFGKKRWAPGFGEGMLSSRSSWARSGGVSLGWYPVTEGSNFWATHVMSDEDIIASSLGHNNIFR